jgi:N,N-dimethylformamidase
VAEAEFPGRKRILAYGDRLTARPGETVEIKVSAPQGARYRAQLVRLRNGDTHSAEASFSETEVASPVNGEYPGRPQSVARGSGVAVEVGPGWPGDDSFSLAISFLPTRPAAGRQHLVALGDDATGGRWSLLLVEGRLSFSIGGIEIVRLDAAAHRGVWHRAAVRIDAREGSVTLDCVPLPASPLVTTPAALRAVAPLPPAPRDADGPLMIGAACRGRSASGLPRPSEGFDGRLESPVVYRGVLTDDQLGEVWAGRRPPELRDRLVGDWDFSIGISSATVRDRSPLGLTGVLRNLPLRGVRGSGWSGRDFRWSHAPEEYGAIAFHSDDLADCEWQTDIVLTVPEDLPSGVYALRLRIGESAGSSVADDAEDYVPFFVAPPRGQPTADTAVLIPTHSYLAYGNVRLWADGFDASPLAADEYFADAIAGPGTLDYSLTLRAHPEIGSSTYDLHADGTPVHTSTWLRPLLNLRPKNILWTLCADLLIVDWLTSQGVDVDILTDDLVAEEGVEALRDYAVVLTGNHPEYVTTSELDALEAYLADGGRMMYLGGNGFYWRCATHPDFPAAIEVRRGRVATRLWTSDVGESDLAFTGEAGGIWRDLGRPPQRLAGVGFIAEGTAGGAYEILPGVREGRAGFLLDGIDAHRIGETGIFGSAVAQEIDRSDPRLGTPEHAIVVARATGLSDGMVFAIEEMTPTVPLIERYRAETSCEVVFFETPGGGAVFSVGSMGWCGSLRSRGVSTDVGRMTRNALDRFRDPTPFSPVPPVA